MNIVHVTQRHVASDGGLTTAVSAIAQHGVDIGLRVTVLSSGTVTAPLPSAIQRVTLPLSASVENWLWHPALKSTIEATLLQARPDVVHIHGVWTAPQLYAAQIASEHGIPIVLTPHNMLDSWLWKRQGPIKRAKRDLYWRFLGKEVFNRAAVIHAVTPLERDRINSMLPHHRIAVIPHAIPSYVPLEVDSNALPNKTILFLGRIHPVKGVQELIAAFSAAQLDDSWSLLLVGPEEDPKYLANLWRTIDQCGLKPRVRVSGPIYGPAKFSLLRQAWIVAVPSYSEVIGMVNLESCAVATPTITTTGTGLVNWERDGGGLSTEATVEGLAKAIKKACSWSLQERLDRGEIARRHVFACYARDIVQKHWASLYSSEIH